MKLTGLARAAAVGLLALFVAEGVGGAWDDSQTSDESVTIASGYAFLRTGRVLINPEHPMLAKAVIAAPVAVLRPLLELDTRAWRAGEQWQAAFEFLWENRVPGRRLVLAARLPVILCGLLLVIGIARLAGELYGPAAGFMALVMAATSPIIVAHSHLATLDIPLALASLWVVIAFLRYAACADRRRHSLLAVAIGVALATKIAALQLLPALVVGALARAVVDPGVAARGKVATGRALPPRLASLYVLWGGLVTASAYGALFLLVTYAGSALRAPGAHPFWNGLVRNAMLTGYGHPTYLAGEISNTGFVRYFLIALGLKLTLPVVAVIAIALVTWSLLRLGRDAEEATLAGFACTLIALASIGPAQTGIRYLLPAYPPLLILASRIAAAPVGGAVRRATGVALVVISLAVAIIARPGYLGYFNELAGGSRNGYRWLADSNVDWGQDLGRLAAWLRARGNPEVRLAYFGNAPPEAYGITYQALPAAGPVLAPPGLLIDRGGGDLLCISVNNLLGLFFADDLYAWLRAREPIAVIGTSIHVYALAGADHAQLERVYARSGWMDWAAHEHGLAVD